MDNYHLNLSWSELDSLRAAMNTTIKDLENCQNMLNAKLDTSLTPELYAEYLGYLANVSRDHANMRSILHKVELSHD